MATVRERAADLVAAIRAVPGIEVGTDPGASIDPPAAVLGAPRLQWEGYAGDGPTTATFLVFVVVSADEAAVERLWDLVPLVVSAIEDAGGFVVGEVVDPVAYPVGNAELPAYEITVETAL